MQTYVDREKIETIAWGNCNDPFNILGPHRIEVNYSPALAIRSFVPDAKTCSVIADTGKVYDMTKIHAAGVFEAVITDFTQPFGYQIKAEYNDGNTFQFYDPYCFPPLLTEFDLHLISEGTHYDTYNKMGAHIKVVDGVEGVHFAVWAPSAHRVSVVGDFCNWNGLVYPMRQHPMHGVWELFIPGLKDGTIYKYEIKSRYNNHLTLKADPYGFAGELRPQNASQVANLDTYNWNDGDWLKTRASHNTLSSPIAIYEVHLGSWRWKLDYDQQEWRWMTYRELAETLVPYVKKMGFTHVEIMPVSEHPFDGSWGYQTTGYYAVTSRYGSPQDFMYLVDQFHQNGISVIMDWVPAHFPKDEHGLGFFDGTHLYEHADPRQGEHPDWGTFIFNFGRNEVRNFLLSNALFWLKIYHIDGLRMDAVAAMLYLDYSRPAGGWIPNRYGGRENLEAIDFIQQFNILVHREHPDVLTIAEESTAFPSVTRPVYLGGLGFDLKWNMGWMNDILRYISKDPVHRRFHHHTLTFSLMYAFSENFLLPFSHDEVVHLKRSMIEKMPGDNWQKFANLRLLYGYMYTHPGKKLLFMGGEIGQWSEWTEKHSLEWHLLDTEGHSKLQQYVEDLNRFYQSSPALYEVDNNWEGFEWLMVRDYENSILGFIRKSNSNSNQNLVVICNFTPIPRYNYRIGVPFPGFYKEVFNSDSDRYWGSNMGNYGGIWSDDWQFEQYSNSIGVTIPPLSTIVFEAPS